MHLFGAGGGEGCEMNDKYECFVPGTKYPDLRSGSSNAPTLPLGAPLRTVPHSWSLDVGPRTWYQVRSTRRCPHSRRYATFTSTVLIGCSENSPSYSSRHGRSR